MIARPGRWLAVVASLAMAAAVAAGLWMMGSPAHQRALRLDARRVTDLDALSLSIQGYWRVHKALPPDLATLDPRGVSRRDPVSGADYAYTRTGPDTYRLCAIFAAASPAPQDAANAFVTVRVDRLKWQHPAGRHCFEQRVAAGH